MQLTVKYFFIFSISFIQFYNSGNGISSVLTYLLLTSLLVFNIHEIGRHIKNNHLKLFYSKCDLLIVLFIFAVIRSFFSNAIEFSSTIYLLFILLFFTLLVKFDVQKSKFLKSVLTSFFFDSGFQSYFLSSWIRS